MHAGTHGFDEHFENVVVDNVAVGLKVKRNKTIARNRDDSRRETLVWTAFKTRLANAVIF